MNRSLGAVATYVARERRFDDIGALQGTLPYASRLGALPMVRTARHFGFDHIDPGSRPEWQERLHSVVDGAHSRGLADTFNPVKFKTIGLLQFRYQLWISRRRLIGVYGEGLPCGVLHRC